MSRAKLFILPGLMLTFVSASALAKVPFAQLETLRRQTVVARVVLDSPQGKEARSCRKLVPPTAMVAAGQNLELATANAKSAWFSEMLNARDLALIRKRAAECALRGSCQVFDDFLGEAKADPAIQAEIGALRAELTKKLTRLDSSSYRKAWASVPEPCLVLKRLVKQGT